MASPSTMKSTHRRGRTSLAFFQYFRFPQVHMHLQKFFFVCTVAYIINGSTGNAQHLWGGAPRGRGIGNIMRSPASPSTVKQENTNPIMEGVCGFPALNPCVPEATCVPSVPIIGEAKCSCPKGYSGDGFKEGVGCVNIDECRSNLHDCDLKTMNCNDLQGTYECTCKPGYDLSPSGKVCMDIDECYDPSLNNCDTVTMTCRNLEGSFRCDCRNENQVMDEDTKMCRDLDECKDMEGAMNPCEQICVNRNPGVECGCELGFKLSRDGRSCEDIDECVDSALHGCDPIGAVSKCINTRGGYRCECNNALGYRNAEDGISCRNFNECEEFPYICGGANSCCQDLAPPHRYACVKPYDNGVDRIANTIIPSELVPPNGVTGLLSQTVGVAPILNGMATDVKDTLNLHTLGWESEVPGWLNPSNQEYAANQTYPMVARNTTRLLQILPAIRSSAILQNGTAGRLGGGSSGGLGNLRMIRNSSCPPGFSLGADLQRARTRAATKQAVQNALLSNTRDSFGDQKPVNPQEVTDSIVKNTALISSELQKWITELTAVPQELVNAAGSMTTPLGSTQRQTVGIGDNPLSAVADLGGISDGTVLGLDPSNWATLLLGGGIGKAIECDPAHDPLCDRSGRSKELGYAIYR